MPDKRRFTPTKKAGRTASKFADGGILSRSRRRTQRWRKKSSAAGPTTGRSMVMMPLGVPFGGVPVAPIATEPKGTGVPGIAMAPHPEYAARILGTGLEVWEIYKTYLEVSQDATRLRRAYHWLTEEQIHAALVYARIHRAAILARIEEDYRYLPEGERPPVLA